ncbi:MAG: hypothetical protein KAJ24_03220 [Candidatus Aenigmarchaeota archaeon]|nr:hypothetical protein [Candidatus Aenigmarchaeota archaeon]
MMRKGTAPLVFIILLIGALFLFLPDEVKPQENAQEPQPIINETEVIPAASVALESVREIGDSTILTGKIWFTSRCNATDNPDNGIGEIIINAPSGKMVSEWQIISGAWDVNYDETLNKWKPVSLNPYAKKYCNISDSDAHHAVVVCDSVCPHIITGELENVFGEYYTE